MNRTHQAIASFTKVLEKNTDNYMALVNLGYAYLMQGSDESALDLFEKAFAVQYHSGIRGTEIYQQLGRLYCRSGQHDKALPVLELWQKNQEGEPEFTLYRLLGEAYAEVGQPTDAMKSLQRALQLYPHDLISMSMLGLLYVEQGEGADAGILLLKKSLHFDDTRADSWYRLARAYMYLHELTEALRCVRRCLQCKRGYVAALILLGKILSASGKRNQAAAVFRRILEMKNVCRAEKRTAEKAIATLLDD
jgi:tetratricopeptide (TPR) repeat protein